MAFSVQALQHCQHIVAIESDRQRANFITPHHMLTDLIANGCNPANQNRKIDPVRAFPPREKNRKIII